MLMNTFLYGADRANNAFFLANEIACIQVVNDDSIQINLSSNFNTDLFTSASLSGPFTEITNPVVTNGGASLTIGNQASQTDVNWFYFYDSFDDTFSDTLSNIVLDVDPMNGAGIANLSWNNPFTTSFQIPANSFYSIMREYPVGNWVEIAQVDVSVNLYLDTITICSDFINYRIDLEIGSSCSFSSNIMGDFFNNNTPPDIPDILQISVDTTLGLVTLTWNVPPQNDVQGYVIVRNIGGFSVAIDTIWDPSTTFYIDYNSEVDIESYAYGIAAFDTCINPNSNPPFFYISPPTALDDFQNSILLQNEYFGCEQYTELEWNTYNNWPDGVLKYQLFVSQDGNPYQLLEEFAADDTSYSHENLNSFSTYCYLIKAINFSETRYSLSNILCQEIVYPGLPDIVYLASSQVDSARDVLLEFYIESVGEIDIEGFTIQALYPTSSEYIDIGFVPYSGQTLYTYVDEDSDADISSIYYRLQVLDGCGNNNFLSNEINTIYLSVITDDENAINTILWNQAEGRAGVINGYTLYRTHDEMTTEAIYFAGPEEFYFQDNLSEEWEKEGDYCYFVVSNEISNPYAEFSASQSNEYCAVIKPRVWIPNSFIVDGDVPTFAPVFAYAGVKHYKMSILDRWGELLYETTDVFSGWDGYYNGNPVKQDAYIYVIQLKDGLGKLLTETGSVTVFSKR